MSTVEYEGCDGGDPGSPDRPSVWLMGIEHGTFRSVHDEVHGGEVAANPDYRVEGQLNWPYNRNAFKLLAALDGLAVTDYREFALERQIFARGSQGYFKGNLYPYASRRLTEWSESARVATGMDKGAYQVACEKDWFPVIRSWVQEYRPRLVIGVGSSFRSQFASAILGQSTSFDQRTFDVNGYRKRMYFSLDGDTPLVIVPHISGSSRGLNSDESLAVAGLMIREWLNPTALR